MSRDNDVLVLGGAGVDTIVYVPRLPLPYADSYMIEQGIRTRAGQTGDFVALGLCALGLRVHHLDMLGDDPEGDLVRALHRERGIALTAVPQPAGGVSFAPKITPADAQVDWKLPAHVVDRQIRACTPDPGAWTELDGVRLKLGPVALDPADSADRGRPGPGGAAAPDLAPGELQAVRNAVLVGTGSRPVLLGDVQAPGKRQMTAPEWARGLRSGGPARFG